MKAREPSGGKVMKINDIIRDLEEIAPPRLADDWDKIGLQVGDAGSDVHKVFVALDPSVPVIDTAVDSGSDLLICHHPLIFSPLDSMSSGESIPDRIIKLIKSDTALYVMHTNFDVVDGGTNDILAERLGVKVTGILSETKRDSWYKAVVFTPVEAVDAVRDAMAEVGAGTIGNYSHCSFYSEGMGTFLPLTGADPYIGTVGKLEKTPEYRLEMIVPCYRLIDVLNAMLQTHPYEEVAYDVYKLENKIGGFGYGRVGKLEQSIKLGEFKDHVEKILACQAIRMVGNPDKQIETVALCTGSGKKFIQDALRARADVYVSADIGYHDFLDADMLGLAIIDAGHFETEFPGVEALAERLSRKYAETSVSVELIKS
jgi:dinuclear metal center YbgI/SA1388 family protein